MPNPGLDLERVTPQYMSDLADPLGDVYEAIVNRLLINVARHFAGGVARGRDMIPGSEQWRAWMLARLGALIDENYRIMAEMAGDVSGLTEQALRRAIYDALKLADKELAAKISAPGYVPTVEESAQNALDMYEAQALNRMNLVNTVLLNSSLEAYSKCVNDTTDYARKLEAAQLTLNRRTGEVIIGAQSFQQARRRAVLEMADAGLTGFIDRGGHNWSASAYVEMDMRTTALQAAREAVMKRNEDYGNDLIMVSSHPGARPGCEPYQGAIYSTTGRSGTVEDLHGKQLTFTPLSGTSYGEPAGLFGINCGHFSAPFIPGASVMRWPKYDKEESERLYEESQRQRYMERKVRKAKLEAEALAAAGDEDGAKEQRKKARELNRQLKDWCEDNGRDYYADRVQIIRTPSGGGNSGGSGNSGNGDSDGHGPAGGEVRVHEYKDGTSSDMRNASIQANEYALTYRKQNDRITSDDLPLDWAGVTSRSVQTIPTGFSAFPKGDVLNDRIKRVKPYEVDGQRYYDVALHGSPTSVGFGTESSNLIARELANFILHREDYHGENIRLLSCSTGKMPDDGDNCFAENLANAIGKAVIAPDDLLYVRVDGSMFIGKHKTGQWHTFTPNMRRRLK